MKRFFNWLDSISGVAYISIVILSVVALTILGFLVISNTKHLNEQQDKLEEQIERTRRALLYTCETTKAVAALTESTITLLQSQPPTPVRLQTINTFQAYLVTLSNDQACREVENNP